MARQYYGIGLLFGKQRNGYFSASADKKLIKESVISILMTRPGERIHLPTYGVGLDSYVFEPNDTILEDILRTRITEQVETWEPGVTVEDIEFRQDENTLNIRLTIQLNDFGGELDRVEYSITGG